MRHDGSVETGFDSLSPELTSRPWWIGLAGWVLQDGNYTDFVTGERRQFALEFGYSRAKRLEPSSIVTGPECRYSGHDSTYDMTGQLLRGAVEPFDDNAFVLDFGLRAYTNWMVLDDLEPPESGSWLTGSVHLHVDHFEYMDGSHTVPECRPSSTPGRSTRFSSTPRLGSGCPYGHPLYYGPDEGAMLVPDPTRESWRTVHQTRTWADNGSYRLRCTLENQAPTNSMAASGSESPYGPLGTE